MTTKTDELIAALDAIDASDPESAHGQADDLLLAAQPQAVRDAYARLVARASWWAAG